MHRNMIVILAGISSLLLTHSARSEEAGTRLAKEELANLLPGTRATFVIKGGSTHIWTNGPDGKLVASTDAKSISNTGMGGGYSARGTWNVSDDGKYCVNIEWKRYPESWCRSLYRMPDGSHYLTDSDDPAAPKRKIELTK